MRPLVCVGFVVIVALGMASSGHGQAQMPNPEIMLGYPAPDFTLETVDGQPVTLSKLKGKIVVLDFWATWCRPCRLYMPDLIAVTDQYKDKDVVLYTVNRDDPKANIQRFMELTKMNAAVLLDKEGTVNNDFFVSSIPHTVFIGKDGTVQSVHVGAEKKSALKKELETLVSGQNLVEPKQPVK